MGDSSSRFTKNDSMIAGPVQRTATVILNPSSTMYPARKLANSGATNRKVSSK